MMKVFEKCNKSFRLVNVRSKAQKYHLIKKTRIIFEANETKLNKYNIQMGFALLMYSDN